MLMSDFMKLRTLTFPGSWLDGYLRFTPRSYFISRLANVFLVLVE